jgi:hypothetical protein
MQLDFSAIAIFLRNYVSESIYPEILSYPAEWHSCDSPSLYSIGMEFGSRSNFAYPKDLTGFL